MPLPWYTINSRISMRQLNEGIEQAGLILDFLKTYADLIHPAFENINYKSLIDIYNRIKSTKELEIESWQE